MRRKAASSFIAAGLDSDSGGTPPPPLTFTGDFIDLFDADLAESHSITVQPGTRALLLDVSYFKSSAPRILAASARITGEHSSGKTLSFRADGIDRTKAVVRILSKKRAREVTLDGKPLPAAQYRHSGRTLLIRFLNTATPQQVQVRF